MSNTNLENNQATINDSSNSNELDNATQQAIYEKLAKELVVKTSQVIAFVELYDAGATVPFIARYRKEKTQGLDDTQLRHLEKSLNYERDMAHRRKKILELLTNQGNLTKELEQRIEKATSKLELDDIYLPYRPRRRLLSHKAKLAGLESIAKQILTEEIAPLDALSGYQPPETLVDESGNEIECDFGDTQKQLAGVQAIIVDEWTQELDLLDKLRIGFARTADIVSNVASEEKRATGEKFKDYFEHKESLAKLPNHRLLAMLRGRQENVLVLKIDGENEPFIQKLHEHFQLSSKAPTARQEFLTDVVKSLWLDKWRPHIEHRLLTEKRLQAESDAIEVFANNLRHLLMAAPAGRKVILGIDPGIRHGVKMAVIDAQGQVMTDDEGNFATATVYPFAPDNKFVEAKQTISALLQKYNVELIAIGNGTASRETDTLVKELLDSNKDLSAKAVVVNESGASVYSASELASDELANLDVSLRGAVSIARRLQDPLSELVKVEPKAIGVGQYQHDVNQTQLADSLDKVTQDCVNAVGVDVNTASPAILAHIAGLNRNVAQQIVNYRKEHGAFSNREQLKKVPRLGVKTFEQSAGFLRIRDGENPLDATGVHPESYHLVQEILQKSDKCLADVLGNESVLSSLDVSNLTAVNDDISVHSVLGELAKPAHDPRPEFKTATFREDVNSIDDLKIGMTLEGVVTNVTAFGCFVDVGVHQDGLVHISEMADDFVKDPINRVKPSDIVQVRVINIDTERNRIGFSMRTDTTPNKQAVAQNKPKVTLIDRDEYHAKKFNKPRHKNNDQRKNKSANHGANKAKSNNNNKIGTLGALLKEAGLGK